MAFAAERTITVLDVAIGGLAAQPAVASVIAGATSAEQVAANVAPVSGSRPRTIWPHSTSWCRARRANWSGSAATVLDLGRYTATNILHKSAHGMLRR